MWRPWLRLLTASVLVVGALSLRVGVVEAKQSPLELAIAVDGDRVNFKLTNQGPVSIAYVDGWKKNLGLPGYAWIEAKDSRGNLLTKTNATPTGQWNPLVFSSDVVVVPIKQLDHLEPGASRNATGSIKASLAALNQVRKSKNAPVKIRLGCKVYLDSTLQTAVSNETPWLSYSSPTAGRRPAVGIGPLSHTPPL